MLDKNLTIIEIRLAYLRTLKGLTQEELAEEINVSRSSVNNWENGYEEISIKQLVKLSHFYHVPLDYLFGLITEFDKSIYVYKSSLDLKELGKKIRIIRKTEGLNQKKFAEKIHTKYSNISLYERGKITIPSTTFKELCNTFGYSADWCVGNTLLCIKRKTKISIPDSDIKKFIEI